MITEARKLKGILPSLPGSQQVLGLPAQPTVLVHWLFHIGQVTPQRGLIGEQYRETGSVAENVYGELRMVSRK